MNDGKEIPVSTEAPEAPLVSPTDKTILYMSRRSDLRLTKRPRYTRRNVHSGELEGVTQGQYVGFRDGQVRIPKSGMVTIQDTLDGGSFEIDAAEMQKWLEHHRLYGDQFDGFWRVEPTTPPVSQSEMQTMMQAAIELDVETLIRIVEEEQAGWAREQILGPSKQALTRAIALREQQAEAEAAAKAGDNTGSAPKGKPKASDA